jgi:hypothetical protein
MRIGGTGRTGRIRISAALAALVLGGSVLTGCSVVREAGTWNDPRHPIAVAAASGSAGAGGTAAAAGPSGAATAGSAAAGPAYDVSSLLDPSRKYLGLEIPNSPDSLTPAKQFDSWVGTKPNILGQYVSWGSSFDAAAAQNAWSYGALDFVVWEPFDTTTADIAAGHSDAYIESFAAAVRALNVPIVLSFGHEFNGDWYPWGTTGSTPAQFVAAWRHIHDLFAEAGATNVIWVWDPNDIYPVPDVNLARYYPGDSYVDWVGVTGYWTQQGPYTYGTLYLPTLEEIRQFTRKPFLIAETAVEAGSEQSASLTDLFQAVEQHSDILGFVWYDYDKGGDWRIENRPSLEAQFRNDLASGTFGFDVSEVK